MCSTHPALNLLLIITALICTGTNIEIVFHIAANFSGIQDSVPLKVLIIN